MPHVKVLAGSIQHPVSKVDNQPGVDKPPVLAPSRPFSGHVHQGQVQHLQQPVIRRGNGLGLSRLSQLAVKALNSVGRIGQPPYLLGILLLGILLLGILEIVLSFSRSSRQEAESLGYFLSQRSVEASSASRAPDSPTAVYMAFRSVMSAFRSL